MHTVKVTRTGNSLDQEFKMKNPLITDMGNYHLIEDQDSKAHKVMVFTLDLLSIKITPQ